MQLSTRETRKLYVELQNEYKDDVPENSVYDDESSGVLAEKSLKSPDLQFETEISTSINGVFSREIYQRAKSRPTQVIPRREIPAEKMQPPAEIEEFFAAAEKSEQKRFAERYNYDIVKDVPLEGKYQWARLHP